VNSAEIAVFAGNFSKFPVIFPVLREFEDQGRSFLRTTGSSMEYSGKRRNSISEPLAGLSLENNGFCG
jgi:hypothetical protein